MKKIKIVMMALMMCFVNVSFGQNFPGEDVELLVGKELRVLERSLELQEYGFRGFFIDSTLENVYQKGSERAFGSTKYSSLASKTFTVLSYQSYKFLLSKNKFKLKIKNNEVGILYFDYDPEFEFQFPFEVIGGLTPPENFYCKKITETTDKFTNEITYEAGVEKSGFSIDLLKVKKGTSTIYYMSIRLPGSTLNVNEKGVSILLENKKRIDKPLEKIDVDYSDGYIYSAFIKLSANDILLLKNNLITDVRLYIYDRNLSIEMSKELQEYLKCLIK